MFDSGNGQTQSAKVNPTQKQFPLNCAALKKQIPISCHRRLWVGLVLAGLPVLLILDALMGLAFRTNTSADVEITVPRSGATHRAIVIFPGYVMPGGTLARAFAPYVADDDAMVVVNYAERGVNVTQINNKVMAALHTLRPVELRVYGASMGGMLGKLFLDRYREIGTPYGKVTLVLDSAPTGRNNIKRPSFLFKVSCWYRGGPLSSAVWAALSKLGPKPPTEDDAPQDIIHAARHAGAWVGMPALTSQACFIAGFGPLKEGELVDVAQQVMYLQGYSPDTDPLVRISDAIAGWRVAFPKLMVITVQGRNGRWHLPLVEYPRATVRAMIATRS
jgi:pimeloyl-ACP methyl ester carboxylesterase